jgi:hypothetical protein
VVPTDRPVSSLPNPSPIDLVLTRGARHLQEAVRTNVNGFPILFVLSTTLVAPNLVFIMSNVGSTGGVEVNQGAALTRSGALVWDERFDRLADRLNPFLAAGFRLSEQPFQVMEGICFSPLSWPFSSDARDLQLL